LTVSSSLHPPGLFHPGIAHGVLSFKAFPSTLAVASCDTRDRHDVFPTPPLGDSLALLTEHFHGTFDYLHRIAFRMTATAASSRLCSNVESVDWAWGLTTSSLDALLGLLVLCRDCSFSPWLPLPAASSHELVRTAAYFSRKISAKLSTGSPEYHWMRWLTS